MIKAHCVVIQHLLTFFSAAEFSEGGIEYWIHEMLGAVAASIKRGMGRGRGGDGDRSRPQRAIVAEHKA